MQRIAQKLSLDYHRDGETKSGKVSKMGVTGSYAVRGDEVIVDLKFPMLVPGSMRKKVEQDIEQRLDSLFA